MKLIVLMLLAINSDFTVANKVDCDCVNCVCVNCNCQSFKPTYAQAIRNNQVVLLEVGNVLHIINTPWKVVKVKEIQGERPGYIVGVPKDGKLIRLDFPPNTTRQRIMLDILHVYYPLGNGYVECPNCPQGRIKR